MMLKHEDASQTPPSPAPASPAASVRVTPEELAAAVTALQIRREGQPGTIAIGDAVEELGLDLSPEEVLAEVNLRRAERGLNTPARKADARGFRLLAVAAGFACIIGGIAQIASSRLLSEKPALVTPASTLPRSASLAAIGNEQPVYVDMHGMKQIIEGVSESEVKAFPHSQGIRWGLIKHAGTLYVQAYTPTVTERRLEDGNYNLHNEENADINGSPAGLIYFNGNWFQDVKVTLPIKAFQVKDSQQVADQAVLTVSSVRPDDHLWDKFEHGH